MTGPSWPDDWDRLDQRPDGARLLDQVAGTVGGYVAFPLAEQRDAVALYIVYTHLADLFDFAPRLSISAPTKRAGKTRLMEVVSELVPDDRVLCASVTAAAVYRILQQAGRPVVILMDEADSVWRRKKGETDPSAEDLRQVFDNGFARGKDAIRCVGPKNEPTRFPTFAPAVLVGIGRLPDTVHDRSVPVSLRRRSAGEPVRKLRQRHIATDLHPLRKEIAGWAAGVADHVDGYEPQLPPGLNDRQEDVFEPLVVVADLAGADWPARARRAAEVLCREDSAEEVQYEERLLADCRTVFDRPGDLFNRTESVTTVELLEQLNRMDESPWGGWPLKAHRLAELLRPFGIRPTNVVDGGKRPKGYRREQFADAWGRYLTEPAPVGATATSATSATGPDPGRSGGVSAGSGSVADGKSNRYPSATGLTCEVAEVAEVAAPHEGPMPIGEWVAAGRPGMDGQP